MKKNFIAGFAFFFLVLFSLVSCKKNTDKKADEDLAQSAQGTYEVYRIEQGGSSGNLPTDTQSASVKLTRADKDKVNLLLTILVEGEAPSKGEVPNVDLKNESSSVAMYAGTDKIGTINGNELELVGNNQGEAVMIKARR